MAISVSLPRVVKHFSNDHLSVRIQNQYRAFKLSVWFSRNIFHITIIQQNIGILSRECKCYLLRRLCIKCFNNSNSRFCVRRVTHCRAFSKQGLSRINLSRIFFSFSCSPSDSRRFFLISLLSGVMVVGSCLLLRSSTASQCKSSSTIVLLTAFSMKLYSWAAFLILRPQGLQTRSDKFSFLVNHNPTEPQQWAKISPALSTLPDGENKFSNEVRPPPEVKLTPQNLQLLFVFLNVYIGFPSPLTNFCRSRDADVLLRRFSHFSFSLHAFGDTFPREVSQAEKRVPNSDWSLKWQLG